MCCRLPRRRTFLFLTKYLSHENGGDIVDIITCQIYSENDYQCQSIIHQTYDDLFDQTTYVLPVTTRIKGHMEMQKNIILLEVDHLHLVKIDLFIGL